MEKGSLKLNKINKNNTTPVIIKSYQQSNQINSLVLTDWKKCLVQPSARQSGLKAPVFQSLKQRLILIKIVSKNLIAQGLITRN